MIPTSAFRIAATSQVAAYAIPLKLIVSINVHNSTATFAFHDTPPFMNPSQLKGTGWPLFMGESKLHARSALFFTRLFPTKNHTCIRDTFPV